MESEFLAGNQDSCLESPEISDSKGIVGPTTPDTDKENGDFPLDLSSPLTVATKLPEVVIFASQANKNHELSSPKTPKDGVFDPFAPGPDDKLWAPQGKKHFDEARTSVARRLTFTTTSFKGFNCCDDSDEKMLESVYENLLEVILSNQTESILAELSNVERDFGACETPPSVPRLNRVAESCPGAPLKPTGETAPRPRSHTV